MDRSGLPGRSRDEPARFKCQDHLMNRWRRDSKVLLHFGLRGRATVDFAVVMDEGQVLTLFIRICFLHRHHSNKDVYAARRELSVSSAARFQARSSSMRLIG